MGPANAMGMFLKVWRSEWAKLSRAQLATAVSASLKKRKAITPRMILYWEEGHPPGSTEELDGLCQVMARSRLSQRTVNAFRRSVLAAVVDRQYPEMNPARDMAERPDVDEVAQVLREGLSEEHIEPDAVQVAAALWELRSALARGRVSSPGRRQTARQQAALCYLRAICAELSFAVDWRVAADLHTANADALALHFGPAGLPSFHMEPWSALSKALGMRARRGGCPTSAQQLLELSRALPEKVPPSASGHMLIQAANILG